MSYPYADGNKYGFDARAGYVNILNRNEEIVGQIYAYNDKGVISANDASGNTKAMLWVGTNDDGVLHLYDSNNNITISGEGNTGQLTCKSLVAEKVKQSAGVVEVVSQSFNSGSKTFDNDDYQTLTVIAKVTSSGSYNISNIPVAFLESTNKRFCISDEASYVTFNIKLDNGVYTIAWYSANSSGSIEKVYAHY